MMIYCIAVCSLLQGHEGTDGVTARGLVNGRGPPQCGGRDLPSVPHVLAAVMISGKFLRIDIYFY